MAKDYVPDRGDLIWLEFDPQAGREQAGRRNCKHACSSMMPRSPKIS